jgi:hypothetical protein
MTNANSRYWLCQVAGWGMVGIMMLFFAHAYKVPMSRDVLLGRIAIVFGAGIGVTHVLRLFIKSRGWIMQSVEKVIPKLAIAMIITSLSFSFLVLGLNHLFKLEVDSSKKLSFVARLSASDC